MKIAMIAGLLIAFLFNLFVSILTYRSDKNPIPENVKDVYDLESYENWKKYHKEKVLMSIIQNSVHTAVFLVILVFNLYALLGNMIENNPYVAMIVVCGADIIVGTVFDCVFSYIDQMKIEEKYGFNKTTMKTFVIDRIKGLLLNVILTIGLLALFILIHQALGDWILLLFTGIMFLFMLFIAFIYPKLSRISNKFTPLEDGELKDKLTALLESHNYKVRAIEVMDASRRTTKLNAYFAGYGKMKTIVLYDNLLNEMETDQIVAVFAHELGHGLHKDTLKNSILSLFNIILIVLIAWLLVRFPSIYNEFGFNEMNYGFAFVLLGTVVLPLISPLVGLLQNGLSRRAEYRADQQAKKEGYKDPLIAGLKILTRKDYGDLSPNPLVVKLTYSHPTISQRIDALEKE